MSKKWASYTFSLFLKHEMSYTSQGRRENKPQTFSADGWTGNQRSSQMWWRNEQELLPLPSREQHETSELNGSGGGRGKDKGAKAFCHGWRHQPGQNGGLLSRLVVPTGTKEYAGLLSRLEPPTGTKVPPFVPVGASNRDKGPCAPYPLPSPPARAIQLTCFLAVLGRDRGVLTHFFTTFVNIFDSLSIHRR